MRTNTLALPTAKKKKETKREREREREREYMSVLNRGVLLHVMATLKGRVNTHPWLPHLGKYSEEEE